MARLDDPFEALGIAPTLDAAEVRKGYFAAVQRHPPHRDAEAFRRVRAAYESLATPADRAAAMLTSPLDLAASLAPLERRFAEALARAEAEERAATAARENVARFVGRYSRVPWVRAFAGDEPAPPAAPAPAPPSVPGA